MFFSMMFITQYIYFNVLWYFKFWPWLFSSQSEVAVSTAKQVPKSNNLEVEMDVMYASDTLTPVRAFLQLIIP